MRRRERNELRGRALADATVDVAPRDDLPRTFDLARIDGDGVALPDNPRTWDAIELQRAFDARVALDAACARLIGRAHRANLTLGWREAAIAVVACDDAPRDVIATRWAREPACVRCRLLTRYGGICDKCLPF